MVGVSGELVVVVFVFEEGGSTVVVGVSVGVFWVMVRVSEAVAGAERDGG